MLQVVTFLRVEIGKWYWLRMNGFTLVARCTDAGFWAPGYGEIRDDEVLRAELANEYN